MSRLVDAADTVRYMIIRNYLAPGERIQILTKRSASYAGAVVEFDEEGILIKRDDIRTQHLFAYLPWDAIEIMTPHWTPEQEPEV